MTKFLQSLDPQTVQTALFVAVIALIAVLVGVTLFIRRQYPPTQNGLPHTRPFVWSPKDEGLLLLPQYPRPVTGPQAFEHINMIKKDGHLFDPAHCPDCAVLELRIGRQVTYPGPIRK